MTLRPLLLVAALGALASLAAAACNRGDAGGGESSPERTERTDLIARQGKPLTLVGDTPEVGESAPAFELVGADMKPVSSEQYAGKTLVISVVPSIDTRVCEAQTHAMVNAEPNLPPNTALLTVSRDLPFAQSRFLDEVVADTRLASDYKGGAFGRAWGLDVKETGLLARSVWVIASDGTIAYRELVADQATEPDYDALLEAVQATAGS